MTWTDLPQPFVRSEARARGATSRRIDLALGRGELRRVAPGLYAVPATWDGLTPWDRHHSLSATASRVIPDAVLSHTSAAALLGLPMPPRPPGRATMTLMHDARTSHPERWVWFHRGATPPAHVTLHEARARLVPSRTVIDCVRVLAPGDALAVLDGALRQRLVTASDLVAMRAYQRRWPGIACSDALFALADGRRETWLESTSAWSMATWGLPPGIPQVEVFDGRDRFVARVDVLWLDLGVVGEADGFGKYLLTDGTKATDQREAAARALVGQARRERRLRDLGLDVVRWGTTDLADPLGLAARVRDTAARARPELVTAVFRCSCCHLSLTHCTSPTRIRPFPGQMGG